MSKSMEIKKLLFEQVRERLDDLSLDDYYRSDMYILRWLQFANFDPRKAADAFRKCLEWRKLNQISTILDEDFSDLIPNFPVDISEVDKKDRIVVRISLQKFNTKGLQFLESREHFLRFSFWINENIEKRLKEQFEKTDGRISQGVVIVDCTNLSEHMKVIGMRNLYPVLILLKEVVSNLSMNFPRGAEDTYVFNASRLFTLFYKAVKPLCCKETIQALHIYGTDTTPDWKSFLHSTN